MKKAVLAAMLLAVVTSTVLQDAQARRVRHGSSHGSKSASVSQQSAQASQAAQAVASASASSAQVGATPPVPAMSRSGLVGGVLAVVGIAALMEHVGVGGVTGTVVGLLLLLLLAAIVALVIYRFWRSPRTGKPNVPAASSGVVPLASRQEPTGLEHGALDEMDAPTLGDTNSMVWGAPADFDSNSFLHNAKAYFIRLQAAWDKADINDLREFTSPEMYAELRLQLQARGSSEHHTEVISLEGELLTVETVGQANLASVKFSGTMKGSVNAAPQPFAEVWTMSKPTSGATGWVLAGIEQLS